MLIIALAAATQFLLPSYISSRIEKQLNDSLKHQHKVLMLSLTWIQTIIW